MLALYRIEAGVEVVEVVLWSELGLLVCARPFVHVSVFLYQTPLDQFPLTHDWLFGVQYDRALSDHGLS